MRTFFAAALAVFFPISCAGCGTPDLSLCRACRAELMPDVSRHELDDGTPVWAALPYGGVVRNVLLQFKENNRTDNAPALASLLSASLLTASLVMAERNLDCTVDPDRDQDGGPDVVRNVDQNVDRVGTRPLELVCVPASAASLRRRGYNPVALLVRRAGFVCRPVLRSIGGGRVQKSLSVDQRRENRRGAFRARMMLTGRVFILIDDVVTTGATVGAAMGAIRDAGGTVVAVVVVAFTPRLH